jgi:hypothetical protein
MQLLYNWRGLNGNEILLFWFTSLIICMVLTSLVYQVPMLESGKGDDDGCSTAMENIVLSFVAPLHQVGFSCLHNHLLTAIMRWTWVLIHKVCR